MCEKIYAWLLRLYPFHFRRKYGEDALQLFRDRSRDERGFFPGLRLWINLLADLAVSIPLEYRHAQGAMFSASARQRLDETPSFQVLEGELPRPGALLSAAFLALVTVGAIPVLIGRGGSYASFGAWFDQPPYRNSAWSPGSGDAEASGFGSPQSQAPQPGPQGANSTMGEGMKLGAAERQRIIREVIASLKEHYVDPAVAQKMAEALLAHEKTGDYDAITEGAAFAALLTGHLRDVSHDLHLEVVYLRDPLPNRPPGPTPERLARYRAAMEQQNCTFEKVQILPHNIGYLKLNSFPDPSVCESTAKAAMASLNDAGAIVFDLRDNRGGYPSMVMLIAAYLFDHPEYMYNPRENTTEQSWTQSPVPGNRLADKPVYVLTSGRTFSGAEHFSYNLKMLRRATLVGETTGGATDVGSFHRIDDHFGMGIRETKAINPYSEPDWAVTGVDPDVKVKAADALDRAEEIAESKLGNR